MMIEIADSGPPLLTDADDFRRLKVLIHPSVDRAGAEPALDAIGRRDGDHLWVDRAWFRQAGPATDEWRAGLDAMLAYAAQKGWSDAEGRIRVHIEHAGSGKDA